MASTAPAETCTGPSRSRLFSNRLTQASSSADQNAEDRYLLQFIRSQFLRAQKHMFLEGDMYSAGLALRQAACAAGVHQTLGRGLEAAVPVWQRRFAGTEGNHLLSTFLKFSETGREANQLARRTLQFGPAWNQGPLELQGSPEINGVLAFALANAPTRFPVWVPGEHENEVFGQDWLWDRLRQEFVYPLLFDGGAAQPSQPANLATRPSRKMLLYGPQGCGKKFLARAAAGMFIEPKKNLAAEVSVCDRESPTRNLAVSLSCSFLLQSSGGSKPVGDKEKDLAKQFIRAAEKIAARLDAWALGRGEEEGVPARTCFFLEDIHHFESLNDKGLEYFLLTSVVSSLAQKFPRVVFICTSNMAPQPWMLDSSLFDSAFFVDFPSRERMAHVVIDTVISTLAPLVASGQPLSRLCKFKEGLLQNVRLHNFALRLADLLTVDEEPLYKEFLETLNKEKRDGPFSRRSQLWRKRFTLLQLQRGLDIPQELAAYFWESGNIGALEPENRRLASSRKRRGRQTSWSPGSVVFARRKNSPGFVQVTVINGQSVREVTGEKRDTFMADEILGHEEFSDRLSSSQALATAHGFMKDSVLTLENFLKLLSIQIEQNHRQIYMEEKAAEAAAAVATGGKLTDENEIKLENAKAQAEKENLKLFYEQFLDWIWGMAFKFYRKFLVITDAEKQKKEEDEPEKKDKRKAFFEKTVQKEIEDLVTGSKGVKNRSKKPTFFLDNLFKDLERGRLYLLQQKKFKNLHLAADFKFAPAESENENELLLLGTPSTNPTLSLASERNRRVQTRNYFEHIMKKALEPDLKLNSESFLKKLKADDAIDLNSEKEKFELSKEDFLGSNVEIIINVVKDDFSLEGKKDNNKRSKFFEPVTLPIITGTTGSASGADEQELWQEPASAGVVEQRVADLFRELKDQRQKDSTSITTVLELETAVRKGVNDFLMERLQAELGVVNGRDLSDKVVQKISRNILTDVFQVDIASLLLNSAETFASPFAKNEEGSLRSLENLTYEIAASGNLGPEGERNARAAGQLLADIRRTRRKQGSTESLFQQRQDVAVEVLATSRDLLDSKLCCCVLQKVLQETRSNSGSKKKILEIS